eukprot:scaffold10355_cov80-Phaeocystis_antarctica.AAC.1
MQVHITNAARFSLGPAFWLTEANQPRTELRSSAGVSPSMVAVGSLRDSGTNATAQTAGPRGGVPLYLLPTVMIWDLATPHRPRPLEQ